MSSGQSPKKPVRKPPEKAPSQGRDMGAALRSVYQQTIDEAVPGDLLDLLGKLD